MYKYYKSKKKIKIQSSRSSGRRKGKKMAETGDNINNGEQGNDGNNEGNNRVPVGGYPNMSKLAGYHNLIPVFDNESSVTPEYFIQSFETLAESLQASPAEKLIVLKSKIRGLALTHLIHSINLTSEANYGEFKKKFLEYFGKKSTLAFRQQSFSGCKMKESETINQFGSRVTNVTRRFLGDIDYTNAEIIKILDQSQLSKFIEGILPKYKKTLLEKNPQTFQEGLEYLQLLEVNSSMLNEEDIINNVVTKGPDWGTIIQRQGSQTHESIAALSREIEELRIHNRGDSSRENSRPINRQEITRGPPCKICQRNNHVTSQCFFRQEGRPGRGQYNEFRREQSQPRQAFYNRTGSALRYDNERRGVAQQQARFSRAPERNLDTSFQRGNKHVRFQSPSTNRFERGSNTMGSFNNRNFGEQSRAGYGNLRYSNISVPSGRNNYQPRNINFRNGQNYGHNNTDLNTQGAIRPR